MVKFDVVVGNPPYQGEAKGDNKNYSAPIYTDFMDSAYSVADKVMLITPGRFLFNAGGTKKAWNRKILKDPYFKVSHYEADSSKVFANTDIKGGIAITYRNIDEKIEPVGIFIPYDELNDIVSKVSPALKNGALSDIIFASEVYKFTDEMHFNHPTAESRLSKGHKYDLKSNIFEKLHDVFTSQKTNDSNTFASIYGRTKLEGRVYKQIKREYIQVPSNFEKWKVFVPQANGSGALGETLSSPVVGQPLTGHTQTFLSIGSFDTELEAKACLQYIKTKFTRVLLGVLKITQSNSRNTWSKIPLQDFTKDSDIDWSKSIAEIDQQLYEKYGLSEEEITFIETHVKEME